MGMMSGYWGYRQLGRFVERHRRTLIQLFQIPKSRVPSYSTLRRVMMRLDYHQLQTIFGFGAFRTHPTQDSKVGFIPYH